MKLTKWTARRSGEHMTITGTDQNGERIRIAGIDRIGSAPTGFGVNAAPRIIAVTKRGDQHELEA